MSDSNRNLVVRITSALVVLPVVLWLVWMGSWWFVALVALASAICAQEFTNLVLAGSPRFGRLLVVEICLALPILAALGATYLDSASPGVVLAAVIVPWPALGLLFFLAHLAEPGPSLGPVPARVGLSLLGVLYVGGLFVPIALLREVDGAGLWWLVLLMAVTWLNDTGAYAAGRAFGRHKLYPLVSPGKTVEGFLGGLAASVGGAWAVNAMSEVALFEGVSPLGLPMSVVVLIGLATGLLGPMGDLCESLLKRAVGAKDSGRILPGHGGLLDRVDALLFNGIVVYVAAVVGA